MRIFSIDTPHSPSHLPAVNGVGILAGLSTAVLWTATAVCFEISSRALGTWLVNVVRLLIAALLFASLSLIRTGALLPAGLSIPMWRDLGLSGLVGFVVGDLLLFKAFVLIGARRSMLIYASVPTITAVLGYFALGEVIGFWALVGMSLTFLGLVLAIAARRETPEAGSARSHLLGILLALGGSLGQAVGLLLGKTGSTGIDCFAATELRVLAGLSGFLLLGAVLGRLGAVTTGTVRHGRALFSACTQRTVFAQALRHPFSLLILGAILGPFLGVALGLKSTQLLPTGIASTLMSIVPALLIPVSAFGFKERVGVYEILGTVLALSGVGILGVV